jgi:hypothetical protein
MKIMAKDLEDFRDIIDCPTCGVALKVDPSGTEKSCVSCGSTTVELKVIHQPLDFFKSIRTAAMGYLHIHPLSSMVH